MVSNLGRDREELEKNQIVKIKDCKNRQVTCRSGQWRYNRCIALGLGIEPAQT
jgi:hypothetical protein